MNYCTKCQSYYEKPRTCNCFAAQGESQPWTVPLSPYQGTFYPVWPQETTYRPSPYTYPFTTCEGITISNGNTTAGIVRTTGTQVI